MLHRYLKIPEEIIKEVSREAEKYKDDRAEYKTVRKRDVEIFPLLENFVYNLGLELAFYRVFLHPPHYNYNVIHIDSDKRKVALNFPIEKESIIHWYEGYPLTALWTEGHVSALIAYKEDVSVPINNYKLYLKDILDYQKEWMPTETVKLSRPLLVRTEVWHKTENLGATPRTLISFMFKGDVKFEDAVEIFEDKG